MDDDTVLVKITWTVADVKQAYQGIFGREPSKEELDKIVKHVDWKRFSDYSTEEGWFFLRASLKHIKEECI